jgi:hypothetical protein
MFGMIGLTACTATVGTGGGVSIPPDAATTCANHCSSIGLSLDSVVVMANNVGCVCRRASSAARGTEGSAAGGMAALIVQEEQQRQQRSPH